MWDSTYRSSRRLTTWDEGDKVWSTSGRSGPSEGYGLTLDQCRLIVSLINRAKRRSDRADRALGIEGVGKKGH